MTTPELTTYCRACGREVDPRATICPACGVAQTSVQPVSSTAPVAKSAGLAIFLSFLWPGAGHLYAGQETEKGIIFTCISALSFLVSLTIVGLVITIPLWLGTAIYTMLDSNKIVRQRNVELGLP